jgi:hypothetical protein
MHRQAEKIEEMKGTSMMAYPSKPFSFCGFPLNNGKIKVHTEKFHFPAKEVMIREEFQDTGSGAVHDNPAAKPRPILTVNVEKYQAFLDGSDMTEAQKEEFLQALWSIIVSFVELGFGVHPLQEICGKTPDARTESAKEAFDSVCLEAPGTKAECE